jgi:carboxymethylenebutenolidase
LTDWIRAVADRLAADGFVAVAPDLLSGLGPEGRGTDAFASRDDVVGAVRRLAPERVAADVEAVRACGATLPASTGKAATVGFCWGGGVSFRAAANPRLAAAVVYYGSAPDAETVERLQAPVLGLYGSDDARVNETIAPAEAAMGRLGKTFEHRMYEGAGHGFLRQQDGREGANLRAAEAAWPEMLRFLRQHTR